MFPVLRSKLVRARWDLNARGNAAARTDMVVFGSNLGWQCFFAALTFGVEVRGFEIVKHRYEWSRQFTIKHQIPGVHFFLEDATQA